MSKTVNPTIPVAIVGGVVVVAIIVVLLIKRGRDAKRAEAERMERILNTPLDRFGDKDLEELEKKYESAGTAAQPAAAPAPGNDGVNTAAADDKADRPE